MAADRRGGGAAAGPGIAQAFNHAILPLASVHDRRTEIAWGLRDFEHRFGRPAAAMWLPETAVDITTLRLLARAGVGSTILAPWQADAQHLDNRLPYRVDTGDGGHVTVVFYDADLSGSVSFEPAVTADADRFARERIAPRLSRLAPRRIRADAPDRERRRAVRAPPVVQGPVPRPPGRPGRGHRQTAASTW